MFGRGRMSGHVERTRRPSMQNADARSRRARHGRRRTRCPGGRTARHGRTDGRMDLWGSGPSRHPASLAVDSRYLLTASCRPTAPPSPLYRPHATCMLNKIRRCCCCCRRRYYSSSLPRLVVHLRRQSR